MKIVDRIFSTMEEKKLKPIDLATALNVNKSVVSSWKNRHTNPPVEYMDCICDFLNVSYEFYLTGENSNNPLLLTLNETEINLISKFRSIPDHAQQDILDNLEVKYNRAFSQNSQNLSTFKNGKKNIKNKTGIV